MRELKVVQKHKQACGREQGPLWRSGGPSSLTPACAPQSPARRPCLSSLTPACTPQSPARRSCLCLQGWVVWGVDPDVEAGPCESCPPSAFGSSGSPGLSLGPGHPVCAQGLPRLQGLGQWGFQQLEEAGGPRGGGLQQAGDREVGKDEGKRLAFIKSRKFIS